uniref:50S ribosomal protein L5, chloroplastic n=1 Tax=Cyanidium caldarium TaxID=2771 RepID=A0A7H0WBB7_CYACA|nr:50S ribosomal protein L5 [Cyanidium caldarium]QNR39846.1 50S ribosomal protein L5 [Cyanidium caldarium]
MVKKYLSYYCKEILHYELLIKLNFDSCLKFPYVEKCIVSLTSPDIILEEDSLLPVLLVNDWISCQRALSTRIKKSVSLFKVVLFKNSEVGVKVTLRDDIIYHFLDILYFCVLLNSQDFPKNFFLKNLENFDSSGNFSFSVSNVLKFPQFNLNISELFKVSPKTLLGFNVVLVFSFNNYKISEIVLKFLQFC